jgi:hypothetical protein
MPIIYGPQNFTAGDFTTASYPGDVFETPPGGSDSPISGYPEFGFLEDVKRVVGTGPNGENVCDVRGAYTPPDTDDYVVAQMTCFAVGDLPDGQYDCRGPIHARIWTKLRADVMEDITYAEPLNLFGGGPTGTDKAYNGTVFAGIWMSSAGTSTFEWGVRYRRRNGGTAGTTTNFTGPSDVADNAWHQLELIVTPATVTGAFNGLGGVGSASVANDGAISVLLDEVEIISLTGLANTINFNSTNNPGVYYGFGYKIGDWDN